MSIAAPGDSALSHASNENNTGRYYVPTNNHRQYMNGIPSNSEIAHYAIPLFLDSNVGCSSRHHVSIMSLMEEQFDCKK